MTTPRLYPQHIYEPVRAEIAISYLKHEFRKLLPGVQDKGWEIIDKNISGWMHHWNSQLLVISGTDSMESVWVLN